MGAFASLTSDVQNCINLNFSQLHSLSRPVLSWPRLTAVGTLNSPDLILIYLYISLVLMTHWAKSLLADGADIQKQHT